MVPCTDRGRPTLVGLIFIGLLVLVACTGGSETEVVSTPEPVPTEIVRDVNAAFAEYRAGVTQGDADAVFGAVTPESLESQAQLVELARNADREVITELPAVDQLILLTYRFQPGLLELDDPYRGLIEAGFAGQDQSVGGLGQLTVVDEQTVLGVVTDPVTGAETPRRWRFEQVDGEWLFDLDEANDLASAGVRAAAAQADIPVDQTVLAEFRRLSGLSADEAGALYEPPE